MSVANQATRGAMWSVGASAGARAVGLVATLYMTRLLAPSVIGEVTTAMIIAQTANWLSHWGFNQYMVVHGSASSENTYHASVVNVVFGVLGLSIVAFMGDILAPVFNLPNLATYLPGLVLAVLIRRLGAVPDKVLARELRFRELAVANSCGEVVYAVTAVALASMTGLGGMSIVVANIFQAVVATSLILWATGLAWFQPCAWRWSRAREVIRFGAPLGLAQVFNFATRYWDNLAFSYFFGPRVVGFYNIAYNLADVPAVQVGEQMESVLLPAMTRVTPAERKLAAVRATALMALAVFPLAIGLGVVAPTLIELILDEAWQPVAPLLSVLAVLSVVRPLGWGIDAYLHSESRTRTVMILEFVKVVLLFGFIAAFASLGPLMTAASVGIAFGVHALVSIALVVKVDRFPLAPLLGAFVRPLLAGGVMALAVLGARHGLVALGVTSPALLLPAEVLAGALVYVPAAMLIAPATSRDFIARVKGALGADPSEPGSPT